MEGLIAMQPKFPSTNDLNLINQHCYDRRADYWDRFPFKDYLPSAVNQFYHPSLGKKVLDVGSGTGILAKWLSEQGFEVVCLDPSDEMVNRCRKKGLNTLQTTIQEYQTKEKFSMVFAILSLIHVPKHELPEQIKKFSGMIAEGGLLFLGMIEGCSEGFQEHAGGYPRFFSTYQKQEVMTLFQDDFTLLDYQYIHGTTQYMVFVFKRSPPVNHF
jgi:2-polyprenyl-3-methyl-5-hydroxy-6-metoxy-1,4-benzoquinol methylase